MQDEQFSLGISILALGFQTWCTEKICLQASILVPAAASQNGPTAPHEPPKTPHEEGHKLLMLQS